MCSKLTIKNQSNLNENLLYPTKPTASKNTKYQVHYEQLEESRPFGFVLSLRPTTVTKQKL